MSTVTLEAPSGARDPIVAFDRAMSEWLVLEEQPVAGMPVLTVRYSCETRARAEHRAGLHRFPITAWYVRDSVLGWLMRPRPACNNDVAAAEAHAAWSRDFGRAWPMDEETSRRRLGLIPGLSLFVMRSNGRLTCPDLCDAERAAVGLPMGES